MDTANYVKQFGATRYAEIGCHKGATTLRVARVLPKGSKVYLFDFQENVESVAKLLEPFTGITVHVCGNSHKARDSYCWNLLRLITKGKRLFDYVYLDGSHDFTFDALAFYLVDRLLVNGGHIEFDDYNWTYARSPTIDSELVQAIYTEAQAVTPHVKLIVKWLVKRHPDYR